MHGVTYSLRIKVVKEPALKTSCDLTTNSPGFRSTLNARIISYINRYLCL